MNHYSDPNHSIASHVGNRKKLPNLAQQIIIFKLQEESFGIPIHWIREVLEPQWYTRIPQSPSIVLGAINHQGKIYTILDFTLLFHTSETNAQSGGNVLLIENQEALLGFHVGKVSEITYYDEDILKTGFEKLTRISNAYVHQVFRYENKIVNMIDVQLILDQLNTILSLG